MSNEPYLLQIWNEDMDVSDLNCLQKACSSDIFGHEAKHILPCILDGSMQFWRGGIGESRFCILTQLFNHPAGLELHIWAVGGEGYVKALDHSYAVLLEFSKKRNCRWITGKVRRKAFEKLYQRFNFNDTSRTWIVEI